MVKFPLTEIQNTVGGMEFEEKDWSYGLNMFRIPVSHKWKGEAGSLGRGW